MPPPPSQKPPSKRDIRLAERLRERKEKEGRRAEGAEVSGRREVGPFGLTEARKPESEGACLHLKGFSFF